MCRLDRLQLTATREDSLVGWTSLCLQSQDVCLAVNWGGILGGDPPSPKPHCCLASPPFTPLCLLLLPLWLLLSNCGFTPRPLLTCVCQMFTSLDFTNPFGASAEKTRRGHVAHFTLAEPLFRMLWENRSRPTGSCESANKMELKTE